MGTGWVRVRGWRGAGCALSAALLVPATSLAEDSSSTPTAAATAAESPAREGPTSTERATQIARDLFDRGKSEYLAGKFESAAALFAASEEQLPRPNTLALLADCYENLGRLKSARDTFQRAEELARAAHDDTLALTARTRSAALSPRIPRLEIRVVPMVPDLSVTLDGIAAPPAWRAGPMPMDAGRYQLEAHAAGYEDAAVLVQIVNDNAQLAGPQIVALRLAPLPLAAPSPPAQPEPMTRAALGQREIAELVGGVGVASLLTAAAFTTASLIYYDDQKCSANRCRQAGYEARHTAIHLATVATVFGLGGVALLGTGATLYFLGAPESEGPVPVGLGAGWNGAF